MLGGLATSRRWRAGLAVATIAVALAGVVCLIGERRRYSGTFDESNHLAAGLEWWQFGTYTMWTENPPLPRLAIAAWPYLHGMRLPAPGQWDPKTHDWDRSWEVGTDLLYAGDGFEANLARARAGTLPFFLLAIAAAWGLAGGARRPVAGFVAAALTSTLPALIAHGALATTDVAFVGTFLLAALALCRWFDGPAAGRGHGRAIALGAAIGLAVLAKLSMIVFFPVAVAAFLVARRLAGTTARPVRDGAPLGGRALAVELALVVAAAFLMTWAGYRFSFGRMDALAPEVKDWLPILPPLGERHGLLGLLLRTPLPMPELFHGLRFLLAHDTVGHEAYFLGKVGEHGFPAFYPVALAVKTPLPMLLLLALVLPLLVRRRRQVSWAALAVALTAAGILLVSLRSHVNLGIRHVFVILPLLAVVVAHVADDGLARWSGRRRALAAAVVGVLVVAQAGAAIAARSRELGYFNVLAGADPATVLLDSDLDWGQDLFALRREARARGVDRIHIAFFGTLRLCQHELPPLVALLPGRPTTGWIAISENYYRDRSAFMLLKNPCDPKSRYREHEVPPKSFAWLAAYEPVTIAGSSIRLYHITGGVGAEAGAAAGAPANR